jgi:hypothetical protein
MAAIADERFGDRLTDQRRAAGDDRGFAVQPSHRAPFFFVSSA